jgi:hypothetical protein
VALDQNKHGNRWKGDDVKSRAVHARLDSQRGSPNECAHCGTTDSAVKYAWAYTNDDPNEKVDADGNRFSTDPSRYVRLCYVCHNGWIDLESTPRGEKHYSAKLTDAVVLECKRRRRNGESYYSMAREFGVTKSVMREAVLGITWKHLK